MPTPGTPIPVEPPPPPGAEGTPRAGEFTKPDAEPAAITDVEVQRLPAYAYPSPQTRGLPFSSLWLTFHGLQWPYMPALNKDQRFVVGLSGFGWLDTAYQKFGPFGMGQSTLNAARIKYLKEQGRFLLRVTPTYAFRDGVFVQGQVELVGTLDQTSQRADLGGADTDDLFLRIGKWNTWDFQVGRFEGWEVFHLGMGLDQNTFERQGAASAPGLSSFPISFYGLTDNQFRPSGPAGNAALHYYPLPYLRFELLGTVGTLNQNNTYATRPVGILDFGWVKLKAGVEYQRQSGQPVDDQTDVKAKGVGGALQFVFLPHVEFGLNAAQGTVEKIDSVGRASLKDSFTRTSFGAFLNVSNGSPRHPVLFGVGSLFTKTEDQDNTIVANRVNEYWLYQGYAAVQYVFRGQFFIKLVGAFSRGHWDTNDPAIVFDNEMYSARLRFAYLF